MKLAAAARTAALSKHAAGTRSTDIAFLAANRYNSVKCKKNCKCGPDKFVATLDWTTYPYTLTYQEIKNNQTINESIQIN